MTSGMTSFLRQNRSLRRLLGLLTLLFGLGLPFVAHASGNDFVDTELRVDLNSVAQARDYISFVAPTAQPPRTGAYTNGWLGLFLGQYDGRTYSGQFSQVGVMTYNTGVQWFVYAEPGVQCLRGTPAWGTMGCAGAFGDLVGLNQWTKVELVTYGQGLWIARVYATNGQAYDVARIWSTSLRIYRAFEVSEEGWWTATDPYLTMSFYHWHPQYMLWGQGFQNWPASAGGARNYLFTAPSAICPRYYGSRLTLSGDARYWWAGSGGGTCSASPQF